ncbi:Serine/threonine-protein kinase polo [Tritrichomonas foetus]|uniref:Serine/threonine-protein kinase polo n=1 Tax=Tritrichomonas foetus TaxID=1144522 RepID=A0A1J4L2Q9_9EUKA|nr:Serine/threonine-protein kinase polo [Tritrichomonas foetus]|eukprot:OHT16238.1 Serine/threonine-protein kinase polo [Tritrichomonas foetus]
MDEEYLIPSSIIHIIPGQIPIIYKRFEELGHGGFARVYRAINRNTGEEVAIKITAKERLKKPKALKKHKAEVEIQMSLNHPNIVKAYDFFEDQLFTYIVLELCPGGSLKNLIKKKTRLTESETIKYMRDILAGLTYIHDNQIIHRDIKLENFLIDKNDNIKIADFGLSARLKYADERKHTVCGTPNYISPELLSNAEKGISFEADIWAVGVSAYGMLAGKLPFQTKKTQDTYEKIKKCDYQFPADISIPLGAKMFVQYLLNLNPNLRPTAYQLQHYPWLNSPVKPKTLLIDVQQSVSTSSDDSKPYRTSNFDDQAIMKINNYENIKQNILRDAASKYVEPEKMCMPKYMVSRFCNHSEKYGLGYLLINGCVGACFKDFSRMIMDPHQQFIQYWRTYQDEKPEILDIDDEAEARKIKILFKFSSSLKKTATMFEIPDVMCDPKVPLLHVKYWARNDDATLFRMNDRNIQLNFTDRRKLVIFWNSRKLMIVSSIHDYGELHRIHDVSKRPDDDDEKWRLDVAKQMLAIMSRPAQ